MAPPRLRAVSQAHPQQVLWLHYEHMVAHPTRCIRQLAGFLELEVSEAAVGRIAAAVQMEEAKRRYLSHEGMGMMLKRGECGVWAEEKYFSEKDHASFEVRLEIAGHL